jgi:hypothetical protein
MPNTTNPIFKIMLSSIGFAAQHERPQTEDGRNPNPNKNPLFFAAREPQRNRQHKRNRSRQQKTNLRKRKFAHRVPLFESPRST